MRDEKLRLVGKFNSEGEMMVYGSNDIKKLGMVNKSRKFTLTIELVDTNPSKAMVGFIYAVIFPELQDGFLKLGERKSLKDIEQYVLSEMKTTEGRGESIEELSNFEKWNLIEECKQFAAENLSKYIPDANTIIK